MKAIKAMQTALLSLAIAGALLGLGGCSLELPEWGNPSGWTPGGPSGGTSGGAGEVVTSAEWAAAFDAKNFTNYQVSITRTDNMNSMGVQGEFTATLRYDGNKCRADVVGNISDSMPFTVYFVKNDDGSYIGYQKNSAGKWETTEDISVWGFYEMDSQLREQYNLMYGAYKYDATEGGYVKTELGGKSVIKIKDGKLISIYVEQSMSTPEGTISITQKCSYTYGGQTVTLPSV